MLLKCEFFADSFTGFSYDFVSRTVQRNFGLFLIELGKIVHTSIEE